MSSKQKVSNPLNIALLTASDSRDFSTDTSGKYLHKSITDTGHKVVDYQIVKDCIYSLRATVSVWVVDVAIHCIITTGGTGFSPKDCTTQALMPLFDRKIDGFGELFRQLSYADIGTSTIQSQSVAGIANKTLIFCLPGSTPACKTGWQILQQQLDSQYRPCNFATSISKQ